MADDDRRKPVRRSPQAYQPIEPIDEGEGGTSQHAGDVRSAEPRAASQRQEPARQEGARQEHPAVVTAPTAPIAVRFVSAAAALAFAGQMVSIGQGEGLAFCSDGEQARWVRTRADLDITRELATAANGETFVEVEPGRLVEDHGWGDPPTTDSLAADPAASVAASGLSTTSLAEFIRIAGLHPVRERPADTVHILLPGWLMASVVRRALDLRLNVAHRPVRLLPLFASQASRTTTAALELCLSVPNGCLPASLLASLVREPQLTVCLRPATTEACSCSTAWPRRFQTTSWPVSSATRPGC